MHSGDRQKVQIIAEIGVNHDGSLERALEMARVARDCGADTVKFQLFRPENLATDCAPLADYQRRAVNGSQIEMLRSLALEGSELRTLQEACRAMGVEFLCSPFDLESLHFLVSDLCVDSVKIASGELTNGPLLWKAARSGATLLLSTGMSTPDEIEEALGVIVLGRGGEIPSGRSMLRSAWRDRSEEVAGVCLLHCTTEYPCPDAEANLRAITTLRDLFGLPVGFSDHTAGWELPLAAVALGAVVVEKHFTLDRRAAGPDHAASLEPADFARMVEGIRRMEVALGFEEKRPTPSELANRDVARKSLVAGKDIRAGEPFGEDNLAAKRPGSGCSPMEYWDVLGQPAGRNYRRDEGIAG